MRLLPLLVVCAPITLLACTSDAPAPSPSTAAAASSGTVDIAWELSPEDADPYGRTRVAVAVRGGASGKIDAGVIFGTCQDAPADLWTAPEKPILMLQCGAAGNYRHVAVVRVDDSLVVRVHDIEENGPDAPTVDTVGAPVKIPARAAVTVGPAQAGAAQPWVPVAAYGEADATATRRLAEALDAKRIPHVAAGSKGQTLSVEADRADEARAIIRDLARAGVGVSVLP